MSIYTAIYVYKEYLKSKFPSFITRIKYNAESSGEEYCIMVVVTVLSTNFTTGKRTLGQLRLKCYKDNTKGCR